MPMSRAYMFALLLIALGIFTFVLTWRVPRGDGLLDRLAPPGLSDRRAFRMDVRSAQDDGSLHLAGSVPGVGRIDSMRWYLDGQHVDPVGLTTDGGHFDVRLATPGFRDSYVVFAYALSGSHIIAMHDPVVLHPPHVMRVLPASTLGGQHADRAIDAHGSIDQIWDGGVMLSAKPEMTFHDAPRVMVVGWALDARRTTPPASVEAVVDGSAVVAGTLDRDRPDVAAVFHNPRFARTGYSITLPSDLLTNGRHEIEVRVVDGTRYAVASRMVLWVTAM
jgi:hypothetical protein